MKHKVLMKYRYIKRKQPNVIEGKVKLNSHTNKTNYNLKPNHHEKKRSKIAKRKNSYRI